jgi:putative ABC transport system permease protein
LPAFEALVGRDLTISWTAAGLYRDLLLLWLGVSLIGGLYPAFVLSWFKPAAILKANRSAALPGSIGLRNSLVIFQFGISIALMIATAVISLQVEYATRHDPGYDTENLLTISGLQSRDPVIAASRSSLKLQIDELAAVSATSLSGHQPMQRFGNATVNLGLTVEGSGETPRLTPTLAVDPDFFATYAIPLLVGRVFDAARDQEATMLRIGQQFPEEQRRTQIILNVSAVRALGFGNAGEALGRQLTTIGFSRDRHVATVIGVVPDTQFFTLRSEARAEAYIYDTASTDVLTLRYEGDAQPVIARIRDIWSALTDRQLQLTVVAGKLEEEFARERIEARMLISFSLLAIAIACLGLYGSAAFAVGRRTREIGIRKVMGAEVREIVALLLWQFSRPVLLANVVAWPVALWAMLTWLQRFPYQIDKLLLIPLCVLAGFAALSIAWITVGGTAAKAASQKPVLALRYE